MHIEEEERKKKNERKKSVRIMASYVFIRHHGWSTQVSKEGKRRQKGGKKEAKRRQIGGKLNYDDNVAYHQSRPQCFSFGFHRRLSIHQEVRLRPAQSHLSNLE